VITVEITRDIDLECADSVEFQEVVTVVGAVVSAQLELASSHTRVFLSLWK